MLLELFNYTVDNYDESLSLLESLKKTRSGQRKLITGLVL